METIVDHISAFPPYYRWLTTALVASASLWIFVRPKKSKEHLPPMAPGGFFYTIGKFFSKDLHTYLLELSRQEGKILRLPISPPGQAFCVVADHKMARKILEDATSKKWPQSYEMFDVAFGGPSFFSKEGARYIHTRKSHSVSLGPQYTDQMTRDIQSSVDEWLATDALDNPDIDVAHELLLLTTCIIGKTAFDYELSQDEKELAVESIRLAYVEVFVNSQKNPLRKLLPFLFAGKRRAQQATKDLQSICKKMLLHHRHHERTKTTLLSFMVQDEAYKNDEERLCDMVAYLAGGFDSTAYSISWTMLELARNPEIQSKLRKELLSSNDPKDRAKNKFLKHVIRESMRLHPIAAAGSIRTTSREFAIIDGKQNYVLPTNSIVVTPFFAIHRDASIYDAPDDFVPQRWESPTPEMQSAFMGFSLGRRNCKGQLFATIEMEYVLARLISDYEWSVEKEGHAEYSVSLKTVGLRLKAKRITQ